MSEKEPASSADVYLLVNDTPAILIVEDETFIAWDMATDLHDAGFDVLGPVETVMQALGYCRSGKLDAAILDINLGSETVWPVARFLEQADIPFLFHTADLDHPELGTEFAHVPILSKPSKKGELIEMLQAVIDKKAHSTNTKVRLRA